MEKAVSDMEMVKDVLTALEQILANHPITPITQYFIHKLLSRFNNVEREMLEVHRRIQLANIGLDPAPYQVVFYELLDRATTLHSAFNGIKTNLHVASSSSPARAPTSSRTHELRLQKLKIPNFDE
jgi:hypothetical protein